MALSIAMAATKGGVSKTTLTACLAVHAAKDGSKVAMVDMDPQQSLTRWWMLRKKPDNPKLFSQPNNLVRDVRNLKASGWQYIFIDTPPGDVDLVVEAIMAADYALIPTRVSALDVMAVEPAVDACKAAQCPFGFVITAYDPKWKMSASAAPYLKKRGPVLDPPIQYRAAYASTMTVGNTGPEAQDKPAARACQDEIATLWRSILGASNG